MRAPDFGAPLPTLYGAALEMVAFLDRIGIGSINLMEHHGFPDNYLPTPFVMGGGVAAVTRRCRISLGAVVLPLHDPVKIAEQIGVLDVMSNGRLEVIIGAGYVTSEFTRFGVSLKDRGRLLDEGLEIILRALHGERTGPGGRDIFVRPLPLQAPEAILRVGGGVEASAKRAARLGLGFAPMTRGLFALYDAECRRHGREPGVKTGPSGFGDIHLSHDPEATWAKVLPYLKHSVADYARIAEESGADSPFRGLLADDQALRASGMFHVMTPEEVLETAKQIDAYGSMTFMPLIGGMPPELGWESLELLEQIMPQLRAIEPAPGNEAEGRAA
ncbi:MAG: LLM class flavin-dependent oxidoreductase [Novosphingobium sp.]|nr:LLM class flavin-dependent oxidoreductase [Novosphingobium sp.]